MPAKKAPPNGKAISSVKFAGSIFKVDTSAEKMKRVKAYFKDIEHIKIPYSGVELQKMARANKKITFL